MIAATAESYSWPKRRWFVGILVVMAGQVGLIFWLARHGAEPRPPVLNAPVVSVAVNTSIRRADVTDPSLFVLPNRHGFSGNAWMNTTTLEYEPLEWTEPPRPLALATEKLGSGLGEFARTSLVESFELASKPEPLIDLTAPPPDVGPTHSTVTVAGELARRPLLSKFKLESWPAPDVLSNSVVQVGVDGEGMVFSAVLVNEPGELKEARAADAVALNLARTAQFQPLSRNDPRSVSRALQWGQLIFRWHTSAPPPTNSTVVSP